MTDASESPEHPEESSQSASRSEEPGRPGPRWGRRLGWTLGVLFASYLLIGAFVLPAVVEQQLVELVRERTGDEPIIGSVSFDPFRLRLTVSNFELPDPAAGVLLATFEELAVDVDLPGFISADIALDEVLLVRPKITALTSADGSLNLMRLLETGSGLEDPPTREAPEEPGSEALPIVDVGAIRIEGGRLAYHDESHSSPFEAAIEPFDLEIQGFTTRPEADSPVHFTMELGGGARMEGSATLGFEPLRSNGRLELAGFDLRLPWEYLSDRLLVDVSDGELGVATDYSLRLEEGLSLKLTEGSLDVARFELVDRTESRRVLSLDSLSLGGIGARVTDDGLASLSIAEIALDGGRLATRIEEDGRSRLVELLVLLQSEALEAEESSESGDATAGASADAPDREEGGEGPEIRVDRLAVSGFDLEIEDRSTPRPSRIALSDLALRVEGYRSAPGSRLALDLETGVGDAGQLALRGPVTLEPLEASLHLEAGSIALQDFEPYLERSARVDLPSGRLSTTLDIVLSTVEGAAPNLAATGRLQVDELKLIDERGKQPFLGWKQLRIEGIDYSQGGGAQRGGRSQAASQGDTDQASPGRLTLEEVGLAGARARFSLGADGSSNVASIFASPQDSSAQDGAPPPSSQAGDSATPMALRIERVSLDDLDLEFRDEANDFEMAIEALTGTIDGLSSDPRSRAKLAIDGQVDGAAPLRLAGELNPLASDAYSDISIDVTGISMPRFNAYAKRYLGRAIDTGQLDMDLDYQLDQRMLAAENGVALRQLELGTRVESEDATTLPVSLALALMRDPGGDIAIELPIRGDLDEPAFSVLGLLRKAAVNLISKAGTAPLALVGGLVGAADKDFRHASFAPGARTLSAAESEKLAILATALVERPALRLEIRGRADPQLDGAALRLARVDDEIRLAAFEDRSARERERLQEPSALVLDPSERRQRLERLYRDRTGRRPQDLLAVGGELPAVSAPPAGEADAPASRDPLEDRMMRALAADIELTESDWRGIARDRAQAVRAAILESGGIEPSRVFLSDVQIDGEIDPKVPSEPSSVAVDLVLRSR